MMYLTTELSTMIATHAKEKMTVNDICIMILLILYLIVASTFIGTLDGQGQ